MLPSLALMGVDTRPWYFKAGVAARHIGINDAGQVAGISETVDGVAHAFVTGRDGFGMADLIRWWICQMELF